MFSAAPNPYDELVVKATDENLASEDWALNLEVCDKVSGDGSTGARNAVGALQKRLSHRNPNVQLYALELANTLAQNCGKPLLEELSSRNWTGAVDRLINDRATAKPVQKKALSYVKSWAKQFEDTGDPNLGLMGELYDQLRAKKFSFDDAEPVPENISADEARRRQEEEELQRVLELSKQDKGGRGAVSGGYQASYPSSGPAASSSSAQPASSSYQSTATPYPPQPEPPAVVDKNSATRVRALYTFSSEEVGELSFEKGDVIKVLDRGFEEWWRGACNGKIGIFPTTYVEGMPEPSPRELQEEAQEEAKVFASLGLVDQLLQTLKSIDPSRGERLEDKPEIEEMYQASVDLQGQITALIKKYSDQKAELEHMNANFVRAMKQYEELRSPPPPQQYGYAPQPDQYSQQYPQYPQQQAPPQVEAPHYQQVPDPNTYHHPAPPTQPGPHDYQTMPQAQPYAPQQHQPYPNGGPAHQGSGDSQTAPAPGGYYHAPPQPGHLDRVPTGGPSFPPKSPPRHDTDPGIAGAGSAAGAADQAQWDAYYRQQAQQQQQQPYGQSPYPIVATGQAAGYGGQAPAQGVDGVTGGMGRMSVHGQ